MAATQQNIADALGLSIITVSRALNNSGYVSKSVKDRVLAYAKEVDYVPHKASQVLQRNRERKLAVFSSSMPEYFWSDIGTGIRIGADQVRAFGYKVEYHAMEEGDTEAYLRALDDEIRRGVEAVAFVNQWIYDMEEVIARLDAAAIPYLTINVDAPDSRRRCYIGPDYREGGALAAEYIEKLLRLKKDPFIVVLNTEARIPPGRMAPDINRLRLLGFEEALKRRHRPIRHRVELITADIRAGSIQGEIEAIVERWKIKADAFYLIPAYNTQFIAALERFGVYGKAVVVHDLDTSSNHYLELDILSAVVDQNPVLQGYYAVRVMEDLLEKNESAAPSSIPIVHSLIMEANKDLYKNHRLFAGLIG